MNKTEVLELAKNAHLSVGELRKKKPELAKPLEERLGRRAQRQAAARLAGGSEKLRRLAERVEIPLGKDPEKVGVREATVKALRDALRKDERLAGDAELKAELQKLEEAAAESRVRGKVDTTLGRSVGLDRPIAFHPEFSRELDAAKFFQLGDVIGLRDETTELLIAQVGKPTEVTEVRLEALVRDEQLTPQEAAAAGLATSLYNILDERPELVATVKTDVQDARELASKDHASWTKLIQDSKVEAPGGISVEAYAGLLESKVKHLFPTDALAHQLGSVEVAPALKSNAALDALRKANPGVSVLGTTDFRKLETAGLPNGEAQQLRAAFDEAVGLVHRYPGMKLDQVLDDTSMSTAQRGAEVTRRTELVNGFFASNTDVLGVDLTIGSAATKELKFTAAASELDKAMVLTTARSYQRAMTITDDIVHAEALVAGGYHSALSVAASNPATVASHTGLSGATAATYHGRARDIAASVTAHSGTVIDVLGGLYGGTLAGNVSTDVGGYLKEIPGFADFFGDQSFCHCSHCQSILGPAAYFVDLMCFVDEHITQPVFGSKPDHPLALESRRPDLWALELTCENTTTSIPYLVVVNEILENAVAQDAGFAGDFGDRVAVEKSVYQDTLPERVDSFQQPLHLPFEELRTYLRHFDVSLADMAEAGGASGDALARLRLGLPPKDFELIVSQGNTSLAFLRRVYGVQLSESGGVIAKFDAQLLLEPMGVTRDELGELIAARYVTGDGAVNVRITSEKRGAQSVQNDVEHVVGATRAVLDRMHRFVRLWRATGWRVGELDLVLTHLEGAGLPGTLNAAVVRAVASVHRLGTASWYSGDQVGVEEWTALWSTLPRHAVLRAAPASAANGDALYPAPPSSQARLTVPLFDRLFNRKAFVEADGSYPKPTTSYLHPALAAAPPAATDPNQHRLLAGLGVTEDELLQLIFGLAGPLGIDLNSAVDVDKAFPLDEGRLSLLYRHARLAKLLRVTVPDLFALAAMTPGLANAHVESLNDLEGVLRLHAWRSTTDWSLADLVRIVRPPQLSPPTSDALDLAEALVAEVAEAESLLFADTIFAFLAPTAPIATSAAPVGGTAGGETVTYGVVLAGRAEPQETVTFGPNVDLAGVIADWNAQATLTRAYRSDAHGEETPTGDHLSIRVDTASGSNTRIQLEASPGSPFAAAEYKGAEVTEARSREILAANAGRVESSGVEGRYRLRAGFDPSAPLALPASIDPSLGPALLELLTQHHSAGLLLSSLPGRVDVGAAELPSLVTMLGANLGADVLFRELRGDVAPVALAQLLDELRPLGVLFEDVAVFDAANLEFIAREAALFDVVSFREPRTDAVANIELFRTLLAPWATRDEPAPDLRSILSAFDPATHFSAANQEDLAALLGCDVGLLHSLTAHMSLGARPCEVLRQLVGAVALATRVGVGGSALGLVQRTSHADLAAASAAIQAAIRSKYPDEAEWETKVEPFQDALLSRRRDGLVAYLVHSEASRFDEVSDLYHYFLLDVELEGCARTSRVAAALDSVQLYVHRCTMNLEESPPDADDRVHVLPESVLPSEWEWRKNYRVWEANRKIFLYPENYIEPELRDNKTPLFRQLEEELLSKEVTDEAILEAYARYLRGFDELAHLTIAGSYHEKDASRETDVLHLFGVTSDEPPTYYYRRIENAHYGVNSDEKATHWGAWEKMNAQVPVRKVSPVVHKGQLYVFWNRYTTKPKNEVTEGTNTFAGYEHRGYVEFCKRRLDGSWTTPQGIRLQDSPFAESFFPSWYRESGAIGDPIVTKSDAIVGFEAEATVSGVRIFFIANASGHAIIHILGVKVEVQLPASTMNVTTTTKVTLGDIEFTVTPLREPTLRAPLYDDQPHAEPKEGYGLGGFGWDRLYPESGSVLSLRGFNFQMWSPVDLYKLQIGARYEYEDVYDTGVPWMNPGALVILLLLALLLDLEIEIVDLATERLIWSRGTGESRELHSISGALPCLDAYSFAALLLDEKNISRYMAPMAISSAEWNRPQWSDDITGYLTGLLKERLIAEVPGDASLEVVNGSVTDVVIQTSRDAFYLQSGVRADGKYHLRRLNTSLSEDIADVLFNEGLDVLLSTETQLGLAEHGNGLELVASEVHDATEVGNFDFDGAMGTYLREIFFHVPFLIANHLNSQGRFEEAQRWYHYVFDPTATESIQGLPAGLSDEERKRRELDRSWRYREFRDLTLDTLRAQLTNQVAIEEYRRDPFNPHAIARLRLSAYQKAVMMKYVDNLLDWGDDLFVRAFSQSNQEYLREATLKYVTAQEILGKRPARLGDCGEGKLSPKNFPKIKDALGDGSEFLMEVESMVAAKKRASLPSTIKGTMVAVDVDRAHLELVQGYQKPATFDLGRAEPVTAVRTAGAPVGAGRTSAAGLGIAVAQPEILEKAATYTTADLVVARRVSAPISKDVTLRDPYFGTLNPKVDWTIDWGTSFVRQVSPIFCVPGNDRMLAHWDRVEDRLYKLRHCMDIEGVPRQLPLFAPPIDPGLLVGGKAAGLSLDDILAAAAGTLPPYRFRYLIEKAKTYAATVQSFGAALLGALEKRDAEELARLRNTHQKNILALTTEVKQSELTIAEEGVEVARRRQAAAQYRFDHYDGLILDGLTPAEITQTAARVVATAASAARLGLATAAGVAHLLPQVGSPFAMKYGGKETGDSLKTFATVAGIVGSVAEMTATISGIVAGFERRQQGWEHQKELAANDLRTLEKELSIAELRRASAARGLEIHEKSKEQHDEVMEFFQDKFSNLGLYTHLSRTLQQLHREAYDNALAMARLAEQAYRFEREGDNTLFVGGEWEASRSGLLAGERLGIALQRMEKRFIETNARSAEINQSFSLTQIDPEALVSLKEVGSCEFALPEFAFDMYYPGHYRRRVRAVRLTIPCITGPYTNVSAKLTLLRSHVRRDAALGSENLFEVPPGGTTSVATSTAQGDAGVFELSFRDERYMPFEGAGAISEWRLELPKQFRPFDYRSINDVILNVSYTAAEDGVLREEVESQNAALAGSLLHYLTNNSLTRVFSLRQEFSSAFNRLTQAAVGTQVTIDINERHFPLFLQGHALNAVSAELVVVPADRAVPPGGLAISVNGTEASGFPSATNPPSAGDALGGLPSRSIAGAFAGGLKAQHAIRIDDPGSLAAAGGPAALDPDKLRDVLLVVQYGL